MRRIAIISVCALLAACAEKKAPPGAVMACDGGDVIVTGTSAGGVTSAGAGAGANVAVTGSTPVGNCESGTRVGFSLGNRTY